MSTELYDYDVYMMYCEMTHISPDLYFTIVEYTEQYTQLWTQNSEVQCQPVRQEEGGEGGCVIHLLPEFSKYTAATVLVRAPHLIYV